MNRIENAKLKLLNQQTIRISIYLTLQRYIKNLTLPNNFMVIFNYYSSNLLITSLILIISGTMVDIIITALQKSNIYL